MSAARDQWYSDDDGTKGAAFYALVKRSRKLPVANDLADLVTCERFACRLQLAACVARYRAAPKRLDFNGSRHSGPQSEACRGCAQGEGRAND